MRASDILTQDKITSQGLAQSVVLHWYNGGGCNLPSIAHHTNTGWGSE